MDQPFDEIADEGMVPAGTVRRVVAQTAWAVEQMGKAVERMQHRSDSMKAAINSDREFMEELARRVDALTAAVGGIESVMRSWIASGELPPPPGPEQRN